MKQKYPSLNQVKDSEGRSQSGVVSGESPSGTGEESGSLKGDTAPIGEPIEQKSDNSLRSAPNEQGILNESEQLVHFEDEVWSFDLSSFGMGIKNIILKKYTDRNGHAVSVGLKDIQPIFSSFLIGHGQPIPMKITQISEREFKGEGLVLGTRVSKIVRVDSSGYTLDTEVYVNEMGTHFIGLSTSLGDFVHKGLGKNFLLPEFDHQEFFTYSQNGNNRVKVSPDKTHELELTNSKVQVAALGTQYFAQAIVDKSDLFPDFKSGVSEDGSQLMGRMSYTPVDKSSSLKIHYTAFAGPKLFENLESISPELAKLVDFGMFSWIAKYILKMMRWFYTLLGNWGLAIILLTIIVRLIVLPFAMLSFKSMKNMQAIQPQIKMLREKYKEDQSRLNQEMMLLMKSHKVNPLGGCLPMFLQFPVFIALYQVLGHSIELYQAPFAFWIHDLSLKDPFYVLPVLMGLTMFIQQKITPNTMDPAQAKILMFMPIIFTFFMVSLPSGLTLYIFISSLFGVLQQAYFVRDKRKLAISEATAK